MCGGNSNFSDFFIRPDRWLREHRDEAKIAAIVAAAVAAPYVVGAVGAAGGAAAAGGVGAAEAGAGLTAAEYAALSGLEVGGASAGQAALVNAGIGAGASTAGMTAADIAALNAGGDYAALSGYEGGAMGGQGLLNAAAPSSGYAGGIDAAAETGGLLGMEPMGTASGNPLEAWGNVDPHALENGVPDFNTFGAQADLTAAKIKGYLTGDNVYKGLKALNAAHRFSSLASPPPAMSQAATRPPQHQGGGGGDSIAALQAFYANPAGQERLKQLLRARGVQV